MARLAIFDPMHDTEASPRRREPAPISVQTRFASSVAVPASEPLGMDTTAARLEEAAVIAPRGREGEGISMGLNAVNAVNVSHSSAVHVIAGGPDTSSVSVEAAGAAAEAVTLVVYGWTAAEPGTLWWAFPSVAAALAAANAMRNAVRWAI